MIKHFFTAFCLLITLCVTSQTVADALKRGSAVTFFGIDFSRAKGVLVGASSTEMRDKYFPAIIELMVIEQQKYDVGKTFYKSNVRVEIRTVDELNRRLDTNNFKAYSSSEIVPLDNNAIQSMIRQYDLKDNSGIGLVFIAESLDKPAKLGTYYLTYFSMPEGNLILARKVSGKPGGFGMRNFWAASVYSILKSDIQLQLEREYLTK